MLRAAQAMINRCPTFHETGTGHDTLTVEGLPDKLSYANRDDTRPAAAFRKEPDSARGSPLSSSHKISRQGPHGDDSYHETSHHNWQLSSTALR